MDKAILLYTMTSGLGDYIVMGDLMHKIEVLLPEAKCLMAHRGNPHVSLWPYDDPSERFFDVYNPCHVLRLVGKLRKAKKTGYTIFGLQMAPGSIQGYFFHYFLKRLGVLDFIVDFNLINADIITPPKGNYILDLHLNQTNELLRVEIPMEFYKLSLPLKYERKVTNNQKEQENEQLWIGIHPWSRRGSLPCFSWTDDKWLALIEYLVKIKKSVLVFGKDNRFVEFENLVKTKFHEENKRVHFLCCSNVFDLIAAVDSVEILITVNTSVAHIGYALEKKLVVLCGPSLEFWAPKGDGISIIRDKTSLFKGADKWIRDYRFASVNNIGLSDVLAEIKNFI